MRYYDEDDEESREENTDPTAKPDESGRGGYRLNGSWGDDTDVNRSQGNGYGENGYERDSHGTGGNGENHRAQDPFTQNGTGTDLEGAYQPGSYSSSKKRPEKAPAGPSNGTALASMLCGLIGTLSLLCCIAFPLSILLGVAAIVLASLSKKGKPFTGLAIAGMVLGILSVFLGIAECFYLIFVNSMLRDPEIAHMLDQMLEHYGAQPAQ